MSTHKRSLVTVIALVLGCWLQGAAWAQLERDPEIVKAYEAGIAALKESNWELAVQAFDQAIALDAQVDGTFAEAYFGRAEALRELEDYQNAIKSYQMALRINDKFAQAYNGRGICFREMGDLNLAFNDFNNAAELDRRDPFIAANLGDVLINNANPNPSQAMQYLDRAIELNPEDAESYRNRGWAHALLQEIEDGIADLEKAIELDPTDYETYQRLSSIQISEDDLQSGIDAISKAIEYYEPKDSGEADIFVNGYLTRASARMELAKDKEQTPEQRAAIYDAVIADADAILAEFEDRYPESGIALYRKGTALRMKEQFAEAITAFTDAIQMIPPGGESNYKGPAYLARGICWYYQGEYKLARGDFKESSALNQVDPLPHLWIGYTYAAEEDYRKAIEKYGEASAKNPSFALPYVNRGLAYMQVDDYDKAVDNFNEAIRAEPTEPTHFYKRGRAREKMEEWSMALDSYELALLRNENYLEAHQGAARALRMLGRPSLADMHEAKAKELMEAEL